MYQTVFPQKTFLFKVALDSFFQTRHSGELFKIEFKISVNKFRAYARIFFFFNSAKSPLSFLLPLTLLRKFILTLAL